MIEIKNWDDVVYKKVKVQWLINNISQWEWLYLVIDAEKRNDNILLCLIEHDEETGDEKKLELTPQEFENFIIGKPCAKDEDTYLGNDYKYEYTLLLGDEDENIDNDF